MKNEKVVCPKTDMSSLEKDCMSTPVLFTLAIVILSFTVTSVTSILSLKTKESIQRNFCTSFLRNNHG